MSIYLRIRSLLIERPMERDVIEFCAGKTVLGPLTTMTMPVRRYIAVDKKRRSGKWGKVPRFRYLQMNIYSEEVLKVVQEAQDPILVGIHACGNLSLRIAEIGKITKAPTFLMPCCVAPNFTGGYQHWDERVRLAVGSTALMSEDPGVLSPRRTVIRKDLQMKKDQVAFYFNEALILSQPGAERVITDAGPEYLVAGVPPIRIGRNLFEIRLRDGDYTVLATDDDAPQPNLKVKVLYRRDGDIRLGTPSEVFGPPPEKLEQIPTEEEKGELQVISEAFQFTGNILEDANPEIVRKLDTSDMPRSLSYYVSEDDPYAENLENFDKWGYPKTKKVEVRFTGKKSRWLEDFLKTLASREDQLLQRIESMQKDMEEIRILRKEIEGGER